MDGPCPFVRACLVGFGFYPKQAIEHRSYPNVALLIHVQIAHLVVGGGIIGVVIVQKSEKSVFRWQVNADPVGRCEPQTAQRIRQNIVDGV